MEAHYNTFLSQVLQTFTNEEFLLDLTNRFIIFIFRFAFALIFFLISKKILQKFLNGYYQTHYFKSIDSSFKTFLSSIIDTGSIIFLLIMSLLIVGFNQTSLIAFLGSIGIGVGLALKDNLANFVGGLIVLIFKTYSVDDEVEINTFYGIVSSIDVFSTTIITFSGDLVTIPNGNVVTTQVINYSKTPTRRMKIVISVSYKSDIDLAFKVLNEMIEKNKNILKNPSPFINIDQYNNSSIDIAIKVWTKNTVYWDTYFELMKEVKKTLDSANISIPFPQMDIHIKEKEA